MGRPGQKDTNKKNKKMYAQQSKKIYANRWTLFLSFSGWFLFRKHCLNKCIKECFCCCCASQINDCCTIHNSDTIKLKKRATTMLNIGSKRGRGCLHTIKKLFRRCCCDDDEQESKALTTYHKGCYNSIKLRVKDSLSNSDTVTIRGISMKSYIETFEDKHRTKLHKEDKILLKHLTADTLFCDQCYQPYLERNVDQVLMEPFRVLLDFISCFFFLFTAYIPLCIFFIIMTFIEYLRERTDQTLHASTNSENQNECEEYDREYFPHALDQNIKTK